MKQIIIPLEDFDFQISLNLPNVIFLTNIHKCDLFLHGISRAIPPLIQFIHSVHSILHLRSEAQDLRGDQLPTAHLQGRHLGLAKRPPGAGKIWRNSARNMGDFFRINKWINTWINKYLGGSFFEISYGHEDDIWQNMIMLIKGNGILAQLGWWYGMIWDDSPHFRSFCVSEGTGLGHWHIYIL